MMFHIVKNCDYAYVVNLWNACWPWVWMGLYILR
jgi:hypothetical protein